MKSGIAIALLILALALPHNADAASANLSLTITGTGTTAPPQAATQGFSTLAFDGDMTKSFDVSCANPATSNHQWYLGGYGTMGGSCNNLTYPFTDATDGSTVLRINVGPSTEWAGVLGRVGIATSDDRGFTSGHKTTFPINAYYECTVRMDAYSISHMGMWHNCWGVNIETADPAFPSSMEYDFTEFHGGYNQSQVVGSAINWPCGGGGSCNPVTWGGNLANYIPGFDPAQFHKYGVLNKQVDANTLHVEAYVDDVFIHGGNMTLDFDINKRQRNYIVVDLTGNCTWIESSPRACSNLQITNVRADANGNTEIVTPNATSFDSGYWLINIQGVTGVTSPINGNYGANNYNHAWWLPGQPCVIPNTNTPQTDCYITVLNDVGGAPIPFTGTYTGGGVVNKWVDPGLQVFVKSFRVWSCPTWQTTECSPFNPN